jgi:hypothetical protein
MTKQEKILKVNKISYIVNGVSLGIALASTLVELVTKIMFTKMSATEKK